MKSFKFSCLVILIFLFNLPTILAQVIEPELTGENLINALRQKYSPQMVLSYHDAREKMFEDIDNKNGKVRLVYTGKLFTTNSIPDPDIVNTEHTWPQGLFNKKHPMKSDLHHLFPTFNKVNGARSHFPFADVPDNKTKKWFNKKNGQKTIPSIAERDNYSELGNHVFEPREDHKGNVARALIYFWVIYGDRNIQPDWIKPQLNTIMKWHISDPTDQIEIDRTLKISNIQQNVNPFILDPTLVGRVLGQTVSSGESDNHSESNTTLITLKARIPLGVPLHPSAGDGSVFARLPGGSVFQKLDEDASTGWIKISNGNTIGWISKKYIGSVSVAIDDEVFQ